MNQKKIKDTPIEETFGGVVFGELSAADKEMVNQGIILPDGCEQGQTPHFMPTE